MEHDTYVYIYILFAWQRSHVPTEFNELIQTNIY